eukprot:616033-Amphidinium_carterae.1
MARLLGGLRGSRSLSTAPQGTSTVPLLRTLTVGFHPSTSTVLSKRNLISCPALGRDPCPLPQTALGLCLMSHACGRARRILPPKVSDTAQKSLRFASCTMQQQ